MGGLDSVLVSLDEGVTGLFGQWNNYTTAMVTLIVAAVSYRVVTGREPDTHPMLLARQAQGSPVRQQGESPVFRSHSSPHGMPLNAGLNVKDAGASKWTRGRDGDLRDIWRRAALGAPDEDGKPSAGTGRLLEVHGARADESSLRDVTRQINLVGRHIHEQGGIRVALYLPNSVELLAAVFACSFYPNLTAILLPFDVSEQELVSMLRRSAADTVITAPGAFPFDAVVKAYPALRQLVWVVDEGSRHMDWNEVPEGTGGSVNVATWQDIVSEAPAEAGLELPPVAGQHPPTDIITFWQSRPGALEEMVRFTQANLVAGIAAQLAALPASQRLSPADTFLPVDSLANPYTLVLTMAALFSNSSVALCSVAGKSPDLVLATQGIDPTVIVATPETLLKTHREATEKLTSPLAKASHWWQSRGLTDNGVMPAPGKLRLIFTAERAGADSAPLLSRVLSDLRVFLGARVIYALTASRVAGAVTQTGYYDYRVTSDGARSHFGPPVTSVELLLRDTKTHKTTDDKYEGEIIARGPSVAGGEAGLGVSGRIGDDNTLSYA
ncbi:hypothetical protein B0T11DRAFT_256045 [Plectosphaerella cucumerina]|uniref:AMP-dependent synthetase/ligase domain-containing protein n=1 Tax=Plectosphaerella cucumerina TaxID=40658 RepID=A0A8K0X3X0_9PEZI|nr:hypothetical protein B0T11DRAFT_256045 [Plectosphaerella cucumerina]